MSFLRELVLSKINELGDEAAAEFFGISVGLVSQWRTGSKSVSLNAVEKVFDPEKLPSTKFEEAAWEGKQVAILLPWYKSVCPPTALSLLSIIDRTKMTVLMSHGDSFIAHARNSLAQRFLKTGIPWSFWADDDVIFPTGNADWFRRNTGFAFADKFAGIHTLNRLLSHNKTIVGGVYCGRTREGKPLYAEACSSQNERMHYRAKGPIDEVRPTKWIATGCLLVHRSVYLDIVKKFPQLDGQWFSTSEHDLVNRTREAMAVLNDSTASESARLVKVRGLFDRGLTQADNNSKLGTGEDVVFSYRAASAGHTCHVDLGLFCGHIGTQVFGLHNTVG